MPAWPSPRRMASGGAVTTTANFLTAVAAPSTITLGSDITVGAMTFDHSQNYTIAADNAITLNSSGNGARIDYPENPSICVALLALLKIIDELPQLGFYRARSRGCSQKKQAQRH